MDLNHLIKELKKLQKNHGDEDVWFYIGNEGCTNTFKIEYDGESGISLRPTQLNY
ncbi:hypothetical protein G9G63_09200 [Paenibacillus sp. EKM202P]|uniref:hypothetical protein n=1 Tax=unclassified Paenibacillus TaxID=185978 RepID=UPI0013EBA1CC|nr:MULTISPECIES: hypothetical protein [unclassified Paenibacillus]KAF6565326.1 hypothetical protein G9G63_09200 [Paenibacillus sp. EKM202P]KAF6569348.1 hypothetical protein G9G64_12890 [Paenibacillus sp. EKM207P]